MGLCRQLKDEILRCPPILVLIGRPDDAWLATWSRADGAVSHPVDPTDCLRRSQPCCVPDVHRNRGRADHLEDLT